MKILIIGQGIAGTLLAWSLRKRGVEVHIADGNLEGAASSVAAGIINPVTGKRFVKSWRFEEFFPVAKKIYQELEQQFNISIWEEQPTLRLLGTSEEANDWSVRCAQAEYTELLGETADAGAWGAFLKPGFRLGLIRKSARVKFPLLLSAFQERARQEGIFIEKNIGFQAFESQLSEYDRVVFCEGWRAEGNPFFPESPFRISKGEALMIRFRERMEGLTEDQTIHAPTEMLKKTVLLAPMGDGTFWVGSTYQWQFNDARPSPEGRSQIEHYLHEMFDTPFEIVDHVAGIRPTMMDRRPVFGQSKLHPKMFIFNGLGTKGALLGPFFAEQLTEELCKS